MTTWDPTLGSHIIDPDSVGSPKQSFADTDIGINITVECGTSKEIVPAAGGGRFVTVYNRGNVPVSLSSLALMYPAGKRLGVDATLRFFVRQSVWANAIQCDDTATGITLPFASLDLIYENTNA